MMNDASAGILRRFSIEPERWDSVVTLPNSRLASHTEIGQSAGWRDVVKKATRVAETHATVLLQGESGTGKEIVRPSKWLGVAGPLRFPSVLDRPLRHLSV
jgi:DNA-binding NtrC family response regulator